MALTETQFLHQELTYEEDDENQSIEDEDDEQSSIEEDNSSRISESSIESDHSNEDDEESEESPDIPLIDPNVVQSKLRETAAHGSRSSKTLTCSFLVIFTFILLISICVQMPFSSTTSKNTLNERQGIELNLNQVNELNSKYPGLLKPKELKTIRMRLSVMQNEVSILMLLGKSKDSDCKSDPTYCVGQTIANVTKLQYGYIDAADPQLKSYDLERELRNSLNGKRYSVMIDNLEKLPGTEVMNLFQFIDRDETEKRRGMLLFIVYTGLFGYDSNLKNAELAEKILYDRWSPFVPKDSLTSLLSRMCGTIVKIN